MIGAVDVARSSPSAQPKHTPAPEPVRRDGPPRLAVALVVIAALLDGVDGRLARALKVHPAVLLWPHWELETESSKKRSA